MKNYVFSVTATPGLEELLIDDLAENCQVKAQKQAKGAVSFEGPLPSAAKVILNSSIASQLFVEIASFECKGQRDFEHGLSEISWLEYISSESTIKLVAHGLFEGKNFKRSFAPLKAKDIICDCFRKAGRERPSVDTKRPDVQIELYLGPENLSVLLALSARPLAFRGYRKNTGAAPLRENKAAALLRFAGFNAETKDLVDPFCGTGTIVIEALRSLNQSQNLIELAPSLDSLKFWVQWQEALLRQVRQPKKAKKTLNIVASDLKEEQLNHARQNLLNAGFEGLISFDIKDALGYKKGFFENKLIVCNPPHGDRINTKEKAQRLLRDFVKKLKFENAPCQLALCLSHDDLSKSVGLKPTRKLIVGNGETALFFGYYEIYGSRPLQAENQ